MPVYLEKRKHPPTQPTNNALTVPFKNLQMESILATAPKKTKLYTNQRVQEAASREKERLERIAKDEQDRLAALYKLEQEEAAKTVGAAASTD